ncbi:hypothetical protein A2U01_0083948, partial [Trifolium medium]|nr:hypothetical protein [Trifolium medium]
MEKNVEPYEHGEKIRDRKAGKKEKKKAKMEEEIILRKELRD